MCIGQFSISIVEVCMKMDKRIMEYTAKLKRYRFIIIIMLAIIGILLFVLGGSKVNDEDTQYLPLIISEIGLALVSNTVLLFLSFLYYKDDDSLKNARYLYEDVGLVSIYDEKSDINEKINEELLNHHNVKEYDIICCGGLASLRKEQEKLKKKHPPKPTLADHVKKSNLKIRILTANPSLDYLLQQKMDEEMMLGKEKTYETTPIRNTIQSDIIELGEWVKSVKEGLPKEKENNIQLRYYNSLPPLQYHRVGNHVFVSKTLVGKNSQATPTIEYFNVDSSRSYYKRYADYFEDLWNDPNYAQTSPNARLNAQLIIGDSLINNILRLACRDICQCLNEGNTNKVRAVLSISDYPKPAIDGKKRRYNTNIVRGEEICDINFSNGESIDGVNKPGYLDHDGDQVVGRANRDQDTKFEIAGEPNRFSILSFPLINNNKDVVANLSFEFDREFNSRLGISDDAIKGSAVNEEKSRIVRQRGSTWATLIGMYLGVNITPIQN